MLLTYWPLPKVPGVGCVSELLLAVRQEFDLVGAAETSLENQRMIAERHARFANAALFIWKFMV